LARPPELSEIEWSEVRAGLQRLPDGVRAEVEARMAAPSGPPYTCAFLDPAEGACLIYAHRPIACRAYGYYVDERGIGLYCGIIREQVEEGKFPDAVWGNFSALDSKVDQLGPRVTK
jgi:Fe-S-cluster containining protein